MNKNTKLKVLVLGGNGFIGSQVVRGLTGRVNVIIGTRKTAIKKKYVDSTYASHAEKR